MVFWIIIVVLIILFALYRRGVFQSLGLGGWYVPYYKQDPVVVRGVVDPVDKYDDPATLTEFVQPEVKSQKK